MYKLWTNLRQWWHHDTIILNKQLDSIDYRIGQLLHNVERLNALEPALGRILAKLDPISGVDENDKQRKLDSDILGDKIMKKLLADDLARRHTLGEL